LTEPKIPDRTFDESIGDLIQSVALEEAALAHLLNAEAEKVQAVAESTTDPTTLLEFQHGVTDMIQAVIKVEMLLQFKLEKLAQLAWGVRPTPKPPKE